MRDWNHSSYRTLAVAVVLVAVMAACGDDNNSNNHAGTTTTSSSSTSSTNAGFAMDVDEAGMCAAAFAGE